ncbi:MAG: mercury methylation corrinoid protein HgcA [Oscillospiraceae bacterium]|nr:mercury methylation corrinoid protein HgcA [Oscillospiraceae bacterium]
MAKNKKVNSCCESGGNCGEPKPTVKSVSTSLKFKDHLGAWKARWGIGRMDYKIEPVLYAVGKPDNNSPVLVSANYKLTFDTLRKNLVGLDCWLLILDTKGINVWCAAGKGTFGTDELVHRIETSELSKYVSHKKLILPQLGATGVSANEVARRSGYNVNYGPVRASDIKEYIDAGCKATKEMRTVKFTLWDRLVLTPMELIPALKITLPVFGVMFLANKFAAKPFDKSDVASNIGAILAGTVLTPALLPAIPGRAFSLKGWLLGLGCTAGILGLSGKFKRGNWLLSAGKLLLYPAVSSYLAMNFTGSSTYTSPSGVNKEMKKALPFIVGSAAVGAALTLGIHLFGERGKTK